MSHKKKSPDLIALAAELYRELKSTQKVARRLELGSSTVHRMLKEAGVDLPDRHALEVQELKKKLHGEQAKQAAADYQSGMSKKDLCAKYGVGWWAIKTTVRDLGLPFRPRGGKFRLLSEETKKEAVRLYRDEKLTQTQVAARLGCAQCVVGRLLVKAGVKIHGPERVRERHGSWKGGKVKTSGGYVNVLVARDDPLACMADSIGYVLEHRLVMARALGRPLADHETVHHLDGDRANNALSNLQLRFGKHGRGIVLKCRCCGSSDIEAVELD